MSSAEFEVFKEIAPQKINQGFKRWSIKHHPDHCQGGDSADRFSYVCGLKDSAIKQIEQQSDKRWTYQLVEAKMRRKELEGFNRIKKATFLQRVWRKRLLSIRLDTLNSQERALKAMTLSLISNMSHGNDVSLRDALFNLWLECCKFGGAAGLNNTRSLIGPPIMSILVVIIESVLSQISYSSAVIDEKSFSTLHSLHSRILICQDMLHNFYKSRQNLIEERDEQRQKLLSVQSSSQTLQVEKDSNIAVLMHKLDDQAKELQYQKAKGCERDQQLLSAQSLLQTLQNQKDLIISGLLCDLEKQAKELQNLKANLCEGKKELLSVHTSSLNLQNEMNSRIEELNQNLEDQMRELHIHEDCKGHLQTLLGERDMRIVELTCAFEEQKQDLFDQKAEADKRRDQLLCAQTHFETLQSIADLRIKEIIKNLEEQPTNVCCSVNDTPPPTGWGFWHPKSMETEIQGLKETIRRLEKENRSFEMKQDRALQDLQSCRLISINLGGNPSFLRHTSLSPWSMHLPTNTLPAKSYGP